MTKFIWWFFVCGGRGIYSTYIILYIYLYIFLWYILFVFLRIHADGRFWVDEPKVCVNLLICLTRPLYLSFKFPDQLQMKKTENLARTLLKMLWD